MTISRSSPRRRRLRRRVGLTLSAAMLAVAPAACGSNDPTGNQTSEAEGIVEQAIGAIQNQPGQWQQVLENTIGQLKTVDADIEQRVNSIVTNAVGQSQSAGLCVSDFFGNRVKEDLQQVVHDIDPKKPAPTYAPVICETDPSTSITPSTTQLVTYYGYNLNNYNQQSPFKAVLKYNDGQVVVSPFGHVDVVSQYKIEVEFQAADFSALDRTRGPELQLSWQNAAVGGYGQASSTLPVVLPAPEQHGIDRIELSAHVPPAGILGGKNCQDFSKSYTIDTGQHAGAVIDRSLGDPGTPGIHQEWSHDNVQGDKTLTKYNALPDSDTQITISGNMCGAANAGPGAIFDRMYDIYWVAPGA